jgi:hypothetical protein
MYKVKKKQKDFKDSTIEKVYEHTMTFSIRDIEQHEVLLEKARREMKALMQVETAKVHNIEQNHSWVKKLTPERLGTAAMYFAALERVSEVYPKLKEVNKQIKEYKEEKALIYKELGFADERKGS